ncbi:NADH-quinone oxidoreductase subunit C [Candidatus Uhrbacteria bacterium]|nr:NADH-quinone oxidoreductase subunit C [Candidatus Uhrbacteria bacterium]
MNMSVSNIITTYIPQGLSTKVHGRYIECEISQDQLKTMCESLSRIHGLPLKTMVAKDERKRNGMWNIFYVFGVPNENVYIVPFISIRDSHEFLSMTSVMPSVAFYEREIREFFGLNPIGHPNPGRWLLHNNWPEGVYPLRKDFDVHTRPEEEQRQNVFGELAGEGVFEIPVGPVHAGIIEPGHFRFGMAGEEIISLEPRLGYTHKGIEKLFETLPIDQKIALSERVSGDSSFTHSMAFCMALEELAGVSVPTRGQYLRVIFSELERLVNHIGDVGLILLGTAYTFGSSQGARLRERVMQTHERLTGSRFLRGVNTIGGVTRDVIKSECVRLQEELREIKKEFSEVIGVVDKSIAVFNRLSNTGTLPTQTAKDFGAVGILARGSGIARDARKDFPYAVYDELQFTVATEGSGDVFARFQVRVKEIFSSFSILQDALTQIPDGQHCSKDHIYFTPETFSVSVVEGWRGDIVYFVATDSTGSISRVHVRDASFLNWPLFSYFSPGNVVLDFPLINKSCNLSYSGNDK